MKHLYKLKLFAYTLLLSISSVITYAQNVSIGVSNYASLSGAFAAINAGTHTGAITVLINASTIESASAVLNASGVGSASYTSILIYPTAANLTITGNLAAPLIDLNGADNIIIDGRVNQSGNRNLVIENTNNTATAGTSTIRFINGAESNTLRYSIIRGANIVGTTASVSSGNIFFSTGGNSNNTIEFCDITNSLGNRPHNGIYSDGTSVTVSNMGNTISNCNFFNLFNPAINSNAIHLAAASIGWEISNNSFYETTVFEPAGTTTARSYVAINTQPRAATGALQNRNITITNNFIGGREPLCAGAAMTFDPPLTTGRPYSFSGILTSNVGEINTIISNNTIRNISMIETSSATPFYGINVLGSTTTIASVVNNIIGEETGTGSISISGTAATQTVHGIFYNSSNNALSIVEDNKIGSITTNKGFTGITIDRDVNECRNNLIGSLTTSNSIQSNPLTGNANLEGIVHNGNNNNNIIRNNTIANLHNASTSTGTAIRQVIGINIIGGTASIQNNNIRNLSNSTASTATGLGASVIGIRDARSANITGNQIFDLANTSTANAAIHIYGIIYSYAIGNASSISNNFIHSISLSTTNTAATIVGYYNLLSTTPGGLTFANNIISLGNGISNGNTIYGIFDAPTSTSTAVRPTFYYFNTVYIFGNTPSSGNTAAMWINTENANMTRNIRNNVFYNARNNTSGSATHYAIRLQGLLGITINYNNYFTSGNGGMLGAIASSNFSNLLAWASGTGQDANSLAFDPEFDNPGGTTDVDYIVRSLLVGEHNVGGITTEFNGATRDDPPTMGAWENPDGLTLNTPPDSPVAVNGPSTVCQNTTYINYSVAPVIGADSYTWSVPIGASVFEGQGTNNVFINFGSASGNISVTANNANGSSAPTLLPFTISTTCPVSVSASVNAAGVNQPSTYNNLGEAFTAINGGQHNANITALISGNITETASAILNASGVNAASYTSVLVYPTASNLSISGNLNAPMIDLNGADNVTFDGRVNQTGAKSLSIQNTNTGTAASTFRFIEGAENNTIRYANLRGSSLGANSGIVFFSTGTASVGNSGNAIEFCDITNAGGNRPINGIYSDGVGTAFAINQNNTFSNNNFFNLFNATNSSYHIQLALRSTDYTMSNNSFYETGTFSPSGTVTYSFIRANGASANNAVRNHSITNNFFGGSAPNAGGTFTINATGSVTLECIYIQAIGDAGTTITGNTITNINFSGTSNATPFYGIVTLGNSTLINASNNVIGAATGNGAITISGTAAHTSFGISSVSDNNVWTKFNNNVVGSITTNRNFTAFAFSRSANEMNGNMIGSTSTANSIQTNPTGTNAATLIGIQYTFITVTNSEISNNTIANLTNNAASTGTGASQIIGIDASGFVKISNNTIRNFNNSTGSTATTINASIIGIRFTRAGEVYGNTIYNFTGTNTSAANHAYGIYYSSGSTAAPTDFIFNNFIHSISLNTSSATAAIYGIYNDLSKRSISGTTFYNNIISLGAGISGGMNIAGIYDASLSATNAVGRYYFNTVQVFGSHTGSSNTYAFRAINDIASGTRDIRNNIFANDRTGGASHFAIELPAIIGTISIDYNNYQASGTGGILGFLGSNRTTLGAWQTATSQDINSLNLNPGFELPGGLIATNYRPSTTLTGVEISGFPNDFQEIARSAPPTMGALNGDFCPPPTQATNLNASSPTAYTNNISWTRGNGTGVLVVLSQGAPLNDSPVGFAFTGNATFGNGSALGNGFVVYNGAGTSVNVTGLNPLTTYFVNVYEYTNPGCYNLIALSGNFTTLTCAPTQASSLNTGANLLQSRNLSWVRGNGNGVVVLISQDAPVSGVPNLATYNANSNFGSGSSVGNAFVVYQGAATNVTVNGLSPETTYHVAIFEYNNPPICYNNTALTGSFTTSSCQPTIGISGFNVSDIEAGAFTVNFTRGNGAGVLVIAKAGSSVDAVPSFNQDYVANSNFGAGQAIGVNNFVVYNGTANSFILSGLTPGVTYHLAFYEYNNSPRCYRNLPLTGSSTTLSVFACGYDVSVSTSAAPPLTAPGNGQVNFSPLSIWNNSSSSIPFLSMPFKFQGTNYTQAYFNSNGYLWFGTSPTAPTTPGNAENILNMPLGTQYHGVIAAIARDLEGHPLSSSSTTVIFNIFGTAPNRYVAAEFVSFFPKVTGSACGSVNNHRIDYQVRFYEDDPAGDHPNRIQVILRGQDSYCNDRPYSFQIGIRGNNPNDFIAYQQNGGNLTSSSASLATSNTDRIIFNSGNFIQGNVAFNYDPYPVNPCLIGNWTGTLSTDWNTPGNWAENAVPLNGSTINIPNSAVRNPLVSSFAPQVGNINIESNRTLTVGSDASITVSGVLNNNGIVIVNSGGALVQTTSSTNIGSGSYQVRRQLPGSNNNYRFLGSPIKNLPASNVVGVPATGTDGAQIIPLSACSPVSLDPGSPSGNILELRENPLNVLFDCAQSLWHIKSVGSLENGKGYAMRANGGQTIVFNGPEVNNGIVTLNDLTRQTGTINDHLTGGVSRGWHLFANPYPSPIILNGLSDLVPQGFDGQIQIYNAANGSWMPPSPPSTSVVLAAGQGFQIRKSTIGGTANFSFNNSMRVPNIGVSYFGENDWYNYLLSLNVEGNGQSDFTKIFFNADATNEFDPSLDVNKMTGPVEQPMLFSMSGLERMAYNGLPLLNAPVTVSLAFYPGSSGQFTISAADLETFPPSAMIYLEDKKTGIWTNLRTQNSYTFSSITSDDIQRFNIHFEPPILINKTDESCLKNDGKIIIENPSNETWNAIISSANQQIQLPIVSGVNVIDALSADIYLLNLDNQGISIQESIEINSENFAVPQFSYTIESHSGESQLIQASVTEPQDNVLYEWFINGMLAGTGETLQLVITENGAHTLALVATHGACYQEISEILTISNVTLAINNTIAEDEIRIFPNPSNGLLNIMLQLSKNTPFENMVVTDVSGRIIQKVDLGGWTKGSLMQIDLSDVADGLYFITFERNRERRTFRISIAR
jgi:hypothetical protein